MLLARETTPPTTAADTQAVWDRFHRELEQYLRRRVPEPAAADLLQEAFVRIHDGLGKLSDEKRLGAWVQRIVRNLVVDYYRRQRPHEPLPELADAAAPVAGDPALPGDGDNNRLVGGWLMTMIDRLPEDYRQALRMVEIEGRTQAEVAERLGLSASGAKSRVQRGRRLLRRTLAECCQVEFDRRGNVLDCRSNSGCC